MKLPEKTFRKQGLVTLADLVKFLQEGIKEDPTVANQTIEDLYIATQDSEIVSFHRDEENPDVQ